jgi:hypothetical protein
MLTNEMARESAAHNIVDKTEVIATLVIPVGCFTFSRLFGAIDLPHCVFPCHVSQMAIAAKTLISEGSQQLELNRIQAWVPTDNHPGRNSSTRAFPTGTVSLKPARPTWPSMSAVARSKQFTRIRASPRRFGWMMIPIRDSIRDRLSRAVCNRAGLKKEGVLRQSQWLHDHFLDMTVNGILRSEWKAQRDGT